MLCSCLKADVKLVLKAARHFKTDKTVRGHSAASEVLIHLQTNLTDRWLESAHRLGSTWSMPVRLFDFACPPGKLFRTLGGFILGK